MDALSKKLAIGVATAVAAFSFASQGQACDIDNNATSPNDGRPIMKLNGIPVHYWDSAHKDLPTEANTQGIDQRSGMEYKQNLINCHTVRNEYKGIISDFHISGPNNIMASRPFKTTKARTN